MYEVVGIEFRQYTNKNGEQKSGYNVHCINKDTRENLTGNSVETIWMSVPMFNEADLDIGINIEVYYNKYGSITKVMHTH